MVPKTTMSTKQVQTMGATKTGSYRATSQEEDESEAADNGETVPDKLS